MRIKIVKTNDVTVEVTPRNAGNYGLFSISGQQRAPKEEYRLAVEIENNIKRHVDNVDNTYVNQKRLYRDEEGNDFNSLYDLLYENLSEDFIGYKYRYERPSDKGIGTSGTIYNFEELIETAFNNPHKFEVADGELLDEQKVFLNKVIQTARNSKTTYE